MIEHAYDEEWVRCVADQDYVILYIHIDPKSCPACAAGVPTKED